MSSPWLEKDDTEVLRRRVRAWRFDAFRTRALTTEYPYIRSMRRITATVPKGAREAIAAVVRTIFAQPDHATAMTQLRKVADGLRARFVHSAALLEDAAEDVLAYRLEGRNSVYTPWSNSGKTCAIYTT